VHVTLLYVANKSCRGNGGGVLPRNKDHGNAGTESTAALSRDHELEIQEMAPLGHRVARITTSIAFWFTTEFGGFFVPDAVNHQIKSIGERLPFPVHAHAAARIAAASSRRARHYSIQAWLGRANVNNTVRYTALSAERFCDFWRD
jgi:type 1 fimbriae regulatory protein FimB/type 1 fimbriae regulatory protein FimE